MSYHVHSLHVAVATPETKPLAWEHPDLRRDASQMAISVSFCVIRYVAIATSRVRDRDSCATGFTFLCSPTCAATFQSETTNERSAGRRGACLLAFPDQLGWEIAGGCSIGFAMTEDLFEETVLHEA